jgi:hypothetical protein
MPREVVDIMEAIDDAPSAPNEQAVKSSLAGEFGCSRTALGVFLALDQGRAHTPVAADPAA